jgi:heptose II phosphotransferase
MPTLQIKQYKGFKIHYISDNDVILGEKLIDHEYSVHKIIKESKRSFVAIISIKEKKYILKEPRNEHLLVQRKFMTLLKKGEAVTTLQNIRRHILEGISEYAYPYICIVKRKNGLISYSSILFEYCRGKPLGTYVDEKEAGFYKDKLIDLFSGIHKRGIYHGDMNVWNFQIEENDQIKILDTQGKKMKLGNYRAHYDMLTFILENYPEKKNYPYHKNIGYFFALFIKKFKHSKFIKKIRKARHQKRNGAENDRTDTFSVEKK